MATPTDSSSRTAGAALATAGAVFLTGTMLGASIAPGYDFHGGAISDLGVVSETAALFNGLLILVGALNVAGGYLLFRSHRRMWLLAAYVLGGVGAIGAGLRPLDTGMVHALFALVGFVFFNVEAIGTGRIVSGPMKAISVVAGVVGLIYVAVMVIGDGGNPAVFGSIGHGGSERMIVYPAMLWLLTFGGFLLARDERRSQAE
ncbi:MAG TPA: DUF998 domain-containing protein [Candidatus Limnocylindrales bacterium]